MAAKKRQARPTTGSGHVATESDLLERGRLGRYEIKKKLGSGGMGAVFLALDPQLNRLVALKILPQDKAENPTLVKRFEAEAQAVAQLTHDHIVRIYESGEQDGYMFIALEYVEGTDVQRLIRKRGRLPVRRSTEIIKQVTLALEHASEAGIVHRDIKPANLLITQSGVVKLTDLGLARALDDEETSITRDGTTVGTVDYMSPEQGRSSKSADIRSDLYSLGCTWYHMLTGTPPYPEGNITNKLQAHAVAAIPDPRAINETVPEAIAGVVARLMAKKPVDRYQSAQELLEDIDAVKKNSRREISASDLAALASPETIEEDEFEPGTSGSEPNALPKRSKTSSSTNVTEEAQSGSKPSRRPRSSAGTSSSTSNSKDSGIESLPPRERKKLSDAEAEQKPKFNWGPVSYVAVALAGVAFIGLLYYVFSGFGDTLDGNGSSKTDLLAMAEERQKEREEEAEKQQQNDQNSDNQNATNPNHQDPEKTSTTNNATTSGNNPVGSSLTPSGNNAQKSGSQIIRIVASNEKTDATSAHSLHDALTKATEPEVIIEFQTKGLTIWDQPVVVEGKKLTLRAGKEGSGLILVNSTNAMLEDLITIRKGTLQLQHLHFGLLGYDLSGNKELTFIRTIDTDLDIRDCSFTIEESRRAPVVLCQSSWSGQISGKSDWQHCLIRGTAWKPFALSGQKFRSTLQGSVLAIGSQPVYTINHTTRFGAPNDSQTPDPEIAKRNLSIKDSIVICQGSMIAINNASGKEKVPSTLVRLTRSSFLASQSVANKPFVSINNWPENILKSAGDGKLSYIYWSSEKAVISGWSDRLMATTSGTRSTLKVQNNQQWEQFWGNTGLKGQWETKTVNPTIIAQPDHLTQPRIISLVRAEQEVFKETSKVSEPALSHKTWRATYTIHSPPRIAFQKDLFAGEIKKIQVDLTKTDLGEFLATEELPEKFILEARGFGLRSCSPISIVNKQVKIRFISEAEKSPLTLRPVDAKIGKNPAWFTVHNGVLALEGGVFRLQPSANTSVPAHWVKAENSAVSLIKCYVTGPFDKHAKLASLIHSRQPNKKIREGNGLFIDRCYLQYGGDVIDASLHANPILVQNSLLVSQNHLFKLNYSKIEKQTRGLFKISHCTLSSRGGLFHFDFPNPAEHARPFVETVVSDTIFVSPLIPDKNKTPVSLLNSIADQNKLASQLWWWGTRNGFSPEVSGELQGRPFAQAWPEFWGLGHVQSPLFGPEGVMLTKRVIIPKELSPAAFTLFPKSKAASWGINQQAIGADVTQFKLSGITSSDSSGSKTDKKPTRSAAPAF